MCKSTENHININMMYGYFKIVISCFFFLQLISISYGQRFKIDVGYGLATYLMNDLKDMNNNIIKNLPVKAQITDDFPLTPFYYAGVNINITSHFYLGVNCSFNTTGSRISYKDFSGELKYDNILSCYSPGIKAGLILYDKSIRVSGETSFSFGMTKLKIKNEILNVTDEVIFNSNSLRIEPGFAISYPLLRRIEVGAKAGYLIDIGSRNKSVDDKNIILKNQTTDDVVKNNWSGLRISASVGLLF